MKKIYSIYFNLYFSLSIQAQDKSKSALDQVTTKVRSYNNIVIDFKYTLNNS
jgi:hypothetical protein